MTAFAWRARQCSNSIFSNSLLLPIDLIAATEWLYYRSYHTSQLNRHVAAITDMAHAFTQTAHLASVHHHSAHYFRLLLFISNVIVIAVDYVSVCVRVGVCAVFFSSFSPQIVQHNAFKSILTFTISEIHCIRNSY